MTLLRRPPIDLLARTWPLVPVSISRNNNAAAKPTLLKLTSSNMSELSACKLELDKLFRGCLVESNGGKVWHSTFYHQSGASSSIDSRRKLQEVELRHKVIIICDNLDSSVRIFGDNPARSEAAAEIVNFVHDLDKIYERSTVHLKDIRDVSQMVNNLDLYVTDSAIMQSH